MKKTKILAISLVVLGVGALAFFLVRSVRIIQQQRQALQSLSARTASLQAQLDDAQKRSGLYAPGRAVENGRSLTYPNFKRMPNGNMTMPYSQVNPEPPPGWTPFQFNGMTYYRIPLASAK